MGHTRKPQSHFNAAQGTGQRKVVETAKMSDPEYAAREFGKA